MTRKFNIFSSTMIKSVFLPKIKKEKEEVNKKWNIFTTLCIMIIIKTNKLNVMSSIICKIISRILMHGGNETWVKILRRTLEISKCVWYNHIGMKSSLKWHFQSYILQCKKAGLSCKWYWLLDTRLFLQLANAKPIIPKRIYNPITAMGFSAMFTFQLDNTKR